MRAGRIRLARASRFFVAPGVNKPSAGTVRAGDFERDGALSGPSLSLQASTPEITATVNLAAPVGTGLYPVTITLPPDDESGVRAEPIAPDTR